MSGERSVAPRGAVALRAGDPSPWDRIDSVRAFEGVPGVYFVTTPGHGGFMVTPDAAARMPAGLRAIGAPFGRFLAFEEDCCFAAVAVAFPGVLEGTGMGIEEAGMGIEEARGMVRELYPSHLDGTGCGRATPAGSFHRCER